MSDEPTPTHVDGVPVEIPAAHLAGAPDAFGRLWTPHRMAYLNGENKPGAADEIRSDGLPACPFCRVPNLSDAEGLIVHRGQHCFVALNLYPYSPGHLLVCPYRHIPFYTELNDAELAEFSELTRQGIEVLTAVSSPQGFNVGMNQGEVAGAGIAMHLHQHIVPRWRGDANFMVIVGQTRAMPQVLGETRDLVAQEWLRHA